MLGLEKMFGGGKKEVKEENTIDSQEQNNDYQSNGIKEGATLKPIDINTGKAVEEEDRPEDGEILQPIDINTGKVIEEYTKVEDERKAA